MSYYWVRERSNKCFQLVRQKFWIVIIVHCHCYHCSLLLSSLLIVIIIIIHCYCSSLVSLCIVAFLILLLQEYGYCGHCALLLYILCIVIVVNCSLCTNLPQSIAHCYCSTLFIVHCYSFLLSIVIGHCSHCMDLILYRTANLAPFQGNLEWYNTIFALNILFRACWGIWVILNRTNHSFCMKVIQSSCKALFQQVFGKHLLSSDRWQKQKFFTLQYIIKLMIFC